MTGAQLDEFLAILRKHGVRKYSGSHEAGQAFTVELAPLAEPCICDPRAGILCALHADRKHVLAPDVTTKLLGQDQYPKDILFHGSPYAVPDEEPSKGA